MKRLTMEPRTPAWYEVRDESWTASMAATLVAKENATLLQSHAAAKGIVLDIDPLLEVGLDEFFENTLWTAWAQKNGAFPASRAMPIPSAAKRTRSVCCSISSRRISSWPSAK